MTERGRRLRSGLSRAEGDRARARVARVVVRRSARVPSRSDPAGPAGGGGGARRPRPPAPGALVRLGLVVVLAGALPAGFAASALVGTVPATDGVADVLRPAADAAGIVDRTPPGNTRILAADGSLITELYRRNRTVVPSEAIAPVVKGALVAIEDSRFYDHGGVDGEGLLRAAVRSPATTRSSTRWRPRLGGTSYSTGCWSPGATSAAGNSVQEG